jgi:tetratricopeptide (TPR) repeat protein
MAADPSLAQPQYVLGLIERNTRHMAAARPYFDRAVELEPRDASTHMYLGQWLIANGYTKQGIAELDRAIAIDPMLPNAVNWRAYQYLYAGDRDNAQALFERTDALGLSLAKGGLGEMALTRGDFAAARRYFAEAAGRNAPNCGKTRPDFELLGMGLFGGDAAAQARSRAMLEDCVAQATPELPAWVVMGFMRMGDYQRALDLAASRPTTDDVGLGIRAFSPQGAGLRRLPGFNAAAEKLGWLDAWEKYGPPDLCTRTAPRVYSCR